MKTTQENFMRMARSVAEKLHKHEAVWSTLPRFVVHANALFDVINQVNAVQVNSNVLSTGARIDKAEAAEAAIHLGVQLSRRAIVYAEDHHLNELRNQLKINKYALMEGHDAELLHKLRDVQKQLEANLLQLPDYGVTPEKLSGFIQATDQYEQLLTRPRDIIIDRKSYNETVAEYVKVVRRLLLKLDNMVNNFEGTDFEHEYHNARIVIGLGSRHRPPDDSKDKAS